MKGIKIVNDPTSPIFSSATSGGINIAGKGVAVANARTITPVKNVNKATGAIETSLVSKMNPESFIFTSSPSSTWDGQMCARPPFDYFLLKALYACP